MKRCEVCENYIHRSSSAKHSKSKLDEENEKIIPTNFFNEPILGLQPIRVVTSFKKLNIRELEKHAAVHMINPYYFFLRYEHQYEIHLYNHHINYINSKLPIKPTYDLTIEKLDLKIIF